MSLAAAESVGAIRQEAGSAEGTTGTPKRPVLRWHGGKWRLAPWIISHFPPHRVYVEPFGGAASVLLRKPRAYAEVYNDLDSEVVNLFRVLRDEAQAARLRMLLGLTPYARQEYHALYARRDDPVERARAFIARSFMGQSSKGALRKSGFDTRINDDCYCSRLTCFRAVADELPRYLERLANTIIEQRPALQILSAYDRPDALFYVDPPYLGDHAPHYNHEMTPAQHAELLEAMRGLASMVVLSGYPSVLYDHALSDWRRVERPALADGARKRTEVLWFNPACAAALDRERSGGPLFDTVEGAT